MFVVSRHISKTVLQGLGGFNAWSDRLLLGKEGNGEGPGCFIHSQSGPRRTNLKDNVVLDGGDKRCWK